MNRVKQQQKTKYKKTIKFYNRVIPKIIFIPEWKMEPWFEQISLKIISDIL